MNNATHIPVKVRFTMQHVNMYRGVINRANRRRFNSLSRRGKLFDNMVSIEFLMHTNQGPFA